MAAVAKWQGYYDRSVLPWDTRLPSSQLVAYLAACPVALAKHDERRVLESPVQADHLEHPARLSNRPATGYHVCDKCRHLKPGASSAIRALELACGTGASCVHMAQVLEGGKVVGVDLVQAAVDAAWQQAADAGVLHRCAFLQADVFTLAEGEEGQPWGAELAWTWAQRQAGRQRQQMSSPDAEQQQQGQAGGARHEPGAHAADGFDFVYDCQAFHALREADEAGYLALLHQSLRPGGVLMLLVGNANEPAVGPAVMTKQEVLQAFPESHWEQLALVQTRFDATPVYLRLPQLPLAWWGLFRRRYRVS